ncbi:hypothetical protein M153_5200002814 [Pseudoloma neurophilia]|uniref:60S acidic ribosomal protein P2 n=1 Tax=Pseudoloma neurophilia TaxID=146866 RepID=A0A0R0M2M0_9MICR|nr:hypothetical protein M153_5200002814 [Pseudoloma neurophilia]
MSVENVNQLYPLASFMINELGQEVTVEKIQNLFKHLNVDFEPKVAELFCLKKEKIDEIYDSVTSAPVAAAAAPVAAATKQETKEEEKPKQNAPAPAEDFDVFGDDLFG